MLCSIFTQAESEHCQLTTQIGGIDWDLLFGNSAATRLTLGFSSLPLHSRVPQVSQGLALVYIMSTNICLGSETILVSSSASPVTLTSGGEGRKSLIASDTGKWPLSPF